MVLQRRETDEEQEMITVFTNYKSKEKSIIEKIITFYQFLKDEDFINFAHHLQIACDICHQQSFELIELIRDIFANISQQNKDSLKNALQTTFRESFFETSGYYRVSTFSGLLCRNNFISQQYVLDAFMEFLNKEEVTTTQRNEMYIIQVLFWCGDILNQFNRKVTSKILKRLERRGYPVHSIFKNNFQISHDINTEGLNPFTDYYCFKYDDVSYLQKQASSPNFDVNRNYEVPIWELDLIRYREVPLISAAAFYGAEKCFRYLQLTGASIITQNDIQAGQFRPGPVALATMARMSKNQDIPDKEYLYSYSNKIFKIFFQRYQSNFAFIRDHPGPAEFAIAGNNIKILHTILQDNDDALRYPLIMAAAYNRVIEFDWLRTRSTIEKETQENLITFLVLNDNEIMFRKLIREDLLNIETSSLYIMQSSRCAMELLSRYNSSLGNYFQYRQIAVFNSDINQKKNPIIEQISNKATPAITNEKNLDTLKMLLNKREIDVDQNASFCDPALNSPNDNIPDECAKELLLSDDVAVFFDKVGRDYIIELIQSNKFSIVEWALQQEKIIKKYKMEQLIANSNSLEMKNLIKKCFNK